MKGGISLAPCGCKDSGSSPAEDAINTTAEKSTSSHTSTAIHQTVQGICKNVVHEEVCLSAQVVVDPIIDIGPITTHCMSKPEIGPCDGKCMPHGSCSFIVRQRLCVEVPIAFGTATTADPLGIVCKGADVGPCKCDR